MTNQSLLVLFQGYKHKGAFLATQAPLESTAEDLWRMVWEQWSASIVMLSTLDEGVRGNSEWSIPIMQ